MMGRSFSPKTVVNYAALGFLVLLGYKIFLSGNGKDTKDPFRDTKLSHPKNIHGRSDHEDGAVLPGAEHLEQKADVDKEIDVGDIPKDLEKKSGEDKLQEKEKEFIQKDLQKTEKPQQKPKKEFFEDGVDWELEKEMAKKRSEFFKAVRAREQPIEEHEFKNMHESDDHFAFVTAASHSTYLAVLQFVYSVQYFYPESKIAIYDIGLTSDERQFIDSLCGAEVVSMWLHVWPESLYKNRHIVWRPLLLQFATAKFGHFIYVEPGRFIYKQSIKEYIQHSRMHGLTIGGKQLKYSSFVVTSPHMYSFLGTDEKKLKKVPHFDFTLIVMHSTKRVNNFFMRYLVSCTLEEYCIAPPGAQSKCDLHLGNKRYGNCHRYDESAINLILNKWHDYKPKEYLMKDVITKYHDGKDMSKKVKVCNASEKVEI
ncbi:uncharacterized protein LOC106078775 [Biomphalaria glabrata]|uniref:Uncharacterized protein LOC106078775 n=1 Tax=Biomphalaria glabrata TaxID=6526 RepID=A0A9U8EMX4_BIOGL|nr:uncharacterized protein LOC106078775 [Biomphalaria glabrata]KAI8733568.1 CAunnamed protein product [Biomphalaria glabrata]